MWVLHWYREGSGETIINCYSNYEIEYVQPNSNIQYIPPVNSSMSYVLNEVMKVEYIQPNHPIKYVTPNIININHECH